MTHWRAPHDFDKVDWVSVFHAMNNHQKMAFADRNYRWIYFWVGVAVGFALSLAVI